MQSTSRGSYLERAEVLICQEVLTLIHHGISFLPAPVQQCIDGFAVVVDAGLLSRCGGRGGKVTS